MKTQLEVAHIISRFKESFFAQYSPPEQVRKVFSHLEQCRTSALGGHVDACPECGDVRISYNSCRDRHCPKCQGNEPDVPGQVCGSSGGKGRNPAADQEETI